MAQMKVFVSHGHQNNAFCGELVRALKGAGADVWYDDESLHTGKLGPTIERELRARPVFIVVLAPAALASQWVEDETRWAYGLYKRDPTRIILPVLAEFLPDENDIWLFLQEFRRIEAPSCTPLPTAQAVVATLRALELTLAGVVPAPATPQPAESVDDLIAHGKALSAQAKFVEALPFFKCATQRDPDSMDGWAYLGLAYNETKRHGDDIRAYDQALALDDSHGWVWSNKGKALADLGRQEEALAAWNRALELDPDDKVTWTNKGSALGRLGRGEEALVAFNRALELDPNDAWACSNKGAAFLGLGRYDEAVAAFNRALELDPSLMEAWAGKGATLRGLARVGEAEVAERRAKELGWQG